MRNLALLVIALIAVICGENCAQAQIVHATNPVCVTESDPNNSLIVKNNCPYEVGIFYWIWNINTAENIYWDDYYPIGGGAEHLSV